MYSIHVLLIANRLISAITLEGLIIIVVNIQVFFKIVCYLTLMTNEWLFKILKYPISFYLEL